MEWHDHWHINKNLWIIITINLNLRHWNFEDFLQTNKIYTLFTKGREKDMRKNNTIHNTLTSKQNNSLFYKNFEPFI